MNRFCSMFSQILKIFPRTEFEMLVRDTSGIPVVLAPGGNLWVCSSVSWDEPILLGKSAMVFQPARGSLPIWAL